MEKDLIKMLTWECCEKGKVTPDGADWTQRARKGGEAILRRKREKTTQRRKEEKRSGR